MNLQSNHLVTILVQGLQKSPPGREESPQRREDRNRGGENPPFCEQDIVIICKCAGAVAYEDAD